MPGGTLGRQASLRKAYNPEQEHAMLQSLDRTPGAPSSAAVLWRRTDITGLEYFTLTGEPDAPMLAGTVIAMPDESPLRVEYAIRCTGAWRTAQTMVEMLHGGVRRSLQLTSTEALEWHRDGTHVAALDGCDDVDLSITPSTNTLPIRRLALAIGESRAVTAAWIRFPSLEIAPLDQRYTRVGERRYRYESGGGAFVAELEVDDRGIVVDYPPAWTRVRR